MENTARAWLHMPVFEQELLKPFSPLASSITPLKLCSVLVNLTRELISV